ncbi:hypothetical protein N7451_007483 [Penicillium sp. IBT 35674x]|nr:hypothetical protein N7451_007483 [Penicillium sp. IBT 35674x]
MILVVGICWFQGWDYDGRIGDDSYLSVEYEIESSSTNDEICGEKQAWIVVARPGIGPGYVQIATPQWIAVGAWGQIFKFGLADKATTDGMTHCNNGAQI